MSHTDHALSFARNGWLVFPLHSWRETICSCGLDDCPSPAKHPRTPSGLLDASTSENFIRDWWRAHPDANIGIRTGLDSRLLVLDIDPRNGGSESFAALLEKIGNLPPTRTISTGGGGIHLYFSIAEDIASRKNVLGNGIDIKARGGYVVAPPSNHKSGGTYKVAEDLPLAPLPESLRTLLLDPVKPKLPETRNGASTSKLGTAALGREVASVACAAEGTRNDTLNTAAFNLGQLVASGDLYESDVERSLLAAATSAGLSSAEAVRTIRSGIEGGKAKPRPPRISVQPHAAPAEFAEDPDRLSPVPDYREEQTDLGNALRLHRLHGENLRYVSAEGAWYVWTPERGVWLRDEDGAAMRAAMETMTSALRETLDGSDSEGRKGWIKHFLKSQSASALRNMLSLAEALPGIGARPGDFDRDSFLLNTPSGTVDLRSGELRLHSREDLLTRITSVPFVPDAQCPRFSSFLSEVFPGDDGLRSFVIRALGYSLTGDTREHAAFFPFGMGANGKSVLLETIRRCLGSYAGTAEASSFLALRDDDNRPRNDLARLRGLRLVTVIETEEGARLAEGTLKSLTGGDTVTARFLFKEHFEFRPHFKLWLATNHKPFIRGTDDGIWRRLRLIPFTRKFSPEEQDQTLQDQLASEAPGILALLVRSAADWYEHGLGEASSVSTATREYREDQDLLGRFLADRCEIAPHHSETSARLRSAFVLWCEGEGERPWSQKAVGMRLQERGFTLTRGNTGRGVQGLRLRPDATELDF